MSELQDFIDTGGNFTTIQEFMEELPAGHEDYGIQEKVQTGVRYTMSQHPEASFAEAVRGVYTDFKTSDDIDKTERDYRDSFLANQEEKVVRAAFDGQITAGTSEDALNAVRSFQDLRDTYLSTKEGEHMMDMDFFSSEEISEPEKASISFMNSLTHEMDLEMSRRGVADMEILNVMSDLAGLYLGADYIKDLHDFAGGVDETLAEIRRIQSLPIALQRQEIPTLVTRIADSQDNNPLKIYPFLELFRSGRAGMAIVEGAAFDLLDASPVAGGALSVFRRATGAMSQRKITKRLEGQANADLSAAIDEGLSGETAVARANVDVKPDFGGGSIDPGSAARQLTEDELAAKMADKLDRSEVRSLGREKEGIESIQRSLVEASPTEAKKILVEAEKKGLIPKIGDASDEAALRNADATLSTRTTTIDEMLLRHEEAVEALPALREMRKARRDEFSQPSTGPDGFTLNPLVADIQKILGNGPREMAGARNPYPMNHTTEAAFNVDNIASPAQKNSRTNRREEVEMEARDAADREVQLLVQRLDIEGEVQALMPKIQKYLTPVNFIRMTENENRKAGRIIEKAEVVKQDKDGFSVKFTYDGGDFTENVKWSIDDVGSYVGTKDLDSDYLANLRRTLSPSVRIRSVDDTLVKDITFGGGLSSRVRNKLANAYQEVYKGLSNKSHQYVDELLTKGDQLQKRYTLSDFRSGTLDIPSKRGGYQFTQPEIEAYYKARAFYDELWEMRNSLTRNTMRFNGFKTYTIDTLSDTNLLAAKKVEMNTSRLSDTEYVYMPQLGKDDAFVNKRQLNQSEGDLLKEGYEMIELHTPLYKGKEVVRFGFVKQDKSVNVGDLPAKVLNKAEGYIPRTYRSGMYFVKDMKHAQHKTYKVFDTRDEAREWIADQNKAMDEAQVLSADRPQLLEQSDRELDTFQRLAHELETYGGMFTRARSEDNLFKAKKQADGTWKDESVDRINASDATARYLSAISDMMPLNEYRMATIQNFKNTVNAIAEKEGKGSKSGFANDDWTSDINITDPKARRALEGTRDYILHQFRVKTTREIRADSLGQKLSDIVEKAPLPLGAKVTTKNLTRAIADKDFVAMARQFAFNMQLGWFNVRQLYVQGQMGMVAGFMHPKYALQAGKDSLEMLALSKFKNYGWKASEVVEQAKKSGMLKDVDDTADLAARLEEVWQSGTLDSITRIADFDAALHGVGGTTVETLRGLARVGMTPYKTGEEFSRLMAWNIARRKLLDEGKKADVRTIFDEAIRIHTNLQRENAAWWQTNKFTSLPTQYLQVQAKFLENFGLGIIHDGKKGGWTRAEAQRAFLGQLMWYGTVDVPIATTLVAMANDKLDLTPEVASALDKGIVGTLAQSVGFDVDVSSPGNLMAGLDDNIIFDMIRISEEFITGTRPDEPLLRSLSGAAGSQVQRAADTAATIAQNVRSLVFNDTSLENFTDALLESGVATIRLTSAGTSATDAYLLWANGSKRTKSGAIQLGPQDTEGLDTYDIMAKALGFKLNLEKSYFKFMEYDVKTKKHEKEVFNRMMSEWKRFDRTGNAEALHEGMAWVGAGLPDTKARDLFYRTQERYYFADSKFRRARMNSIRHYIAYGKPLHVGAQ